MIERDIRSPVACPSRRPPGDDNWGDEIKCYGNWDVSYFYCIFYTAFGDRVLFLPQECEYRGLSFGGT